MTTNEEQQSFYSYQLAENLSISFDTYNEVLHHFRTTSAQHPNARGGDYFYDIIKGRGYLYSTGKNFEKPYDSEPILR